MGTPGNAHFGVALWEILNFAGVRPHADLSETEVGQTVNNENYFIKVGRFHNQIPFH